MTLDPVLTLGTDKHIDIFVQGIVTVPYCSMLRGDLGGQQ